MKDSLTSRVSPKIVCMFVCLLTVAKVLEYQIVNVMNNYGHFCELKDNYEVKDDYRCTSEHCSSHVELHVKYCGTFRIDIPMHGVRSYVCHLSY